MASPRWHSKTVLGVPRREKPRFDHLLEGFSVLGISNAVLWLSYRHFVPDAVISVLSTARISATKILGSDVPMLAIELLDGSSLNIALTWQRSGLVSIAVFGLLFLFFLFPLEGPIWLKLAWLELGLFVGLTWSLIRLSIASLIAFSFGSNFFTITEFLTGPFTDLLWALSLWSIALSSLVSSKRKK